MTRKVNSYFGILVITIAGAISTLLIVRSVYQTSFYTLGSGYGTYYYLVPVF